MDNKIEDGLLGYEGEDKDLKQRVCIESKKFWKTAFPSIITRITSFGILMVTQAFMGYIGDTELASYALVQTIILRFANGILLGMASALETLCGQAFGAGQYHMMGIYMQRSWIVVFATGTILLPLYIFATPFLRFLGEEEELALVAGEIALWFIPIIYYFALNFTMQMFLQAQLKNSIVGWLSSASFVIHLVLSWLFVCKLNWGIPGAMGAMIASMWSSTIGLFVYIYGGWSSDTWKGFSISALSDLSLSPVVKLSASYGMMLCLELWYYAILVLLAGHMKNAEVSISAFSICLNVVAWQLMIFLGFLTAASVRVSNELGRGDAKAAKFSIQVILATSLCIGLIFWILTLVFGKQLSYLFSSSTVVAQVVSSLSILLSFSVLLNSIQPVVTGVAVGAGWQAPVAFVNIGSYYAVGIPIGALLAYVTDLNVMGLWIGLITGVAVQTPILIFITWRTDWDAQVEKVSARLNRWFLPRESDDNHILEQRANFEGQSRN